LRHDLDIYLNWINTENIQTLRIQMYGINPLDELAFPPGVPRRRRHLGQVDAASSPRARQRH